MLVPGGITWLDAKIAAEQRTFLGRAGHLATITSYEEDLYLEFRRQEASVPGYGELWVGGYQIPGSEEPGGGWVWLNNEGSIPGTNEGPVYANWKPSQPDNWLEGGSSEDFLTIGLDNYIGWNDSYHGVIDGYVVEYEAEAITIDIKPGDAPNVIYLSSNGKIPVAVLSSTAFDATRIDPASVRFGRKGTEAAPESCSFEDVNKDKQKDLICTFNTQDTELVCNDTTAVLRAKDLLGYSLRGSDSVQLLLCPQFALSVTAMQDVNKLTDVYLTMNVLGNNLVPPLSAQHVQLKSVDPPGRLRWSTNYQQVPFTPTSTTSSVVAVQVGVAQRFEPLKAQVSVPSGQGNNLVVLRGEGRVLLRPDLEVTSVTARSPMFAGAILNISALISEMNGDVGTTATAYLMEGTTLLDEATGIQVGPRGSVTVVFPPFSRSQAHST